jgi:pimeloyl-ACP methyl ester carboxylesterase
MSAELGSETSHPIPMQSTRIDAGGIGIHLLEAGTGAPALFLHGYPTNAQLWRHVIPAVGRRRRALAIDLPGFGDSDAPNDARYDLAFVHQTIDAVLDALGIDKLGLCVHDAGGYYGLTWAVAHPERITDLCLLNTLASPAAGFIVRATIGAFQTPGLRSTMLTQWGLRMGMNIGMSRRRLDTHAMSLYTAPFLKASHREAFLKCLRTFDFRALEDVDRGMAQFSKIPVRMIYGTKDRILPAVAQTMDRVKEHLPHAEITRLEGVGHFLQEDDPEEVARLVSEFFSRS